MVVGNGALLRKREQRGKIEGDRHEFAHARRAPRLIDDLRACVAAHRDGNLHLLLFTERQEIDARSPERNVERLLARRDDSPEFGQFRLEGRDLHARAGPRFRVQLVPSVEKQYNAGLRGGLRKSSSEIPRNAGRLRIEARIAAPSVAQSPSGTTSGVPLPFASTPSAIWKSVVVFPMPGGATRIRSSSDVTAPASAPVVTGSSNPSTSSVSATEVDGHFAVCRKT